MPFSLTEWADTRRLRLDALLPGCFSDAWPERFAEACVYPLQTGGKRMRPLLVFAAAEAVGGTCDDAVVSVGAAVELIHTYSLVHDDLPCMDDDDERRGRPTVHVAYGEAAALLVGDALLTEAFALLARAPFDPARVVQLVAELAQAAGHRGMVGGQAADIGLGGAVSALEQVVRLHRGKTGALIRAASRMGGIAAGADKAALDRLTRYGGAVGLAFQLADDLLDMEQDAGSDGPPSFVKVLGEQETRARAGQLLKTALEAAEGLPHPEPLVALARYTVQRDH